jgi:hypothetical protein
MGIVRPLCILACVWLGAGQFVLTGQTKYGVTVKVSKPAALAKLKTYVWSVSHPSSNKNIDAVIVASVDRELGARGFTKLPTGRGDLSVTYASVSRTDVDVKKAAKGESSEYDVGTLVVDLSDPGNRELLFSVRVDTPIERDRAALEATINAAVKAMFDKYPAPPKR